MAKQIEGGRSDSGGSMSAKSFENFHEKHAVAGDWRALYGLYEENAGLSEQLDDYWDRLVGAFEQIGSRLDDPEEKSRLLMQLGDVWQRHLTRSDRAMACYQGAFKLWHGNTPALERARALYRGEKRLDMVLRLYELQLKVAEEGKAQADVLTAIGRMLLQEAADPTAAQARLTLALTVDPTHPEARQLLAEATGQPLEPAPEAEGTPTEVAGAVEAAAEPEEGTEEPKAAVEPPTEAAEELPSEAAEEPPTEATGEPPTEAAEEPPTEAAEEPPTEAAEGAPTEAAEELPTEAAEELPTEAAEEPPTEAAEEPPTEAAEEPPTEEPVEAPRGLLERARAAQIRDDKRALYAELLSTEPDNVPVLKEYAEVLRSSGDVAALLPVLEQIAEQAHGEDRERALAAVGSAYAQALGDPEAAHRTYSKLLDLNPVHPQAVQFARRYATEREDWEALRSLYERIAKKRSRPDLGFDPTIELADLLWQRLDDVNRAEVYYKRIRLSDPKNPRMLAFYADYYRQRQDHKRLLSTLNTIQQQADDSETRLALALEMADVAENGLEQPERAIHVWKSLYDEDPTRPEPVVALRRLYTQTRKYNALLEFLKEEAERCDPDESERRVELLFEIADVYSDHLNLDTMEANTLAEILSIDPDNERAAEALVTRYEASGRWADLVGLLGRQAAREDDPAEEAVLRRRMATIWSDHLGNLSHAIPELERVVQLEPEDLQALADLREIYSSRNESQALLTVLERQAALASGDKQLEILREMAQVARDRLADEDQTVRIAERLLDVSGGRDSVALALLEEIYRGRQDWAELARTLEAKREAVDSRQAELALLLELGDLRAERLDQRDEALEVYRQALEVDPESERAIDRIVALYVSDNRWDELHEVFRQRGELGRFCRLLEQTADGSDDEAVQLALYRRIAAVAGEELHEPERVIRALETILRLRPEDMATVEALMPYYEGAGEHRKLADVLAQLAATRSGAEALSVVRRIVQIYETDLRDREAALEWAGRAVQVMPSDEPSHEDFERLGRELGQLPQVVDVLATRAARETGDVRLTLLRQAARLCYQPLRDTHAARAAELYSAILAEDEADREAISALEALYGELGQSRQVLDVLRHRLALVEDAEASVELKLRMAAIQGEELDDLEGAVETFEQVLEDDPVNVRALEQLKYAYFQMQDWPRVVEVARRELDAVPEQRSVVLFELGQVLQHKLEDLPAAVEAYCELVRDYTDSQLGSRAVSQLEALAEDEALRPRIAEALEPVHRAHGDGAKLVEALEVLITVDDQSPELRRQRLWELAELSERELGDARRAFVWMHQAALEDPRDERAWAELERLAELAEGWEAAAQFYAGAYEEEPENLRLARRLARILEARLDRPSQAVSYWERIYRDNPTDTEAGEALERLYQQTEDVDALVGLLRERADNAESDAARKEALFTICDVLQNAGRPMEAREFYQRVFDLDQTDTRAFEALRVILDAAEQWEQMAGLLEARLVVCDPAEMPELRMNLGSLREGALNDPDGAAEAYREVLVDDPEHEAAAKALERLFRSIVERDDLADLRDQIYRTLRATYEMRSAWEQIVRLEELQLADPARQLERGYHFQLVGEILRDRLERPTEALAAFSSSLETDFENSGVRAEVERLTQELGAWDRLAGLYERGLEVVEDYLRVDLHRRLARIQDEHLGDAPSAIVHYQAVREVEPDDRGALNALERLLESTGQLDELVEVRQHKADLVSGAERLDLLRKNAEALSGPLADPDAAIGMYLAILADSPGDGDALDALEGQYTQLERWDDLNNILFEKVNLAVDAEERRALYQQIATVREDRLDDPDGAIEAYHAMLDIEPGDATALVALERLYEQTERWADLADILRRQMGLSEDPAYRNHVALRLGGVLERRLYERSGAIELYRDILESEPDNMYAVVALEDAISDEDHRLAAIDVLIPIYERGSKWSEVLRLLESQLAVIDDPDRRLQTLLRIQEVAEAHLSDRDKAFSAACRAYELSPTPGLREHSERLAAVTGDFAALSEAYEGAVGHATSDEEALSIHLRLASLYLTTLGRADRAEAHFRQALDLVPSNLEALEALESILQQQDRPADLLEILERRVELARDAGEVNQALAYLYRVADLHESALGQPGEAILAWQRAIELEPTDERAAAGLSRLLRSSERWVDLIDELGRQIRLSEDAAVIASLNHAVGLIEERELDDPERGVETYAKALAVEPAHEPTVAALEGLLERLANENAELAARTAEVLDEPYRQGGNWSALARALEVRAVTAESGAAAQMLTESASLYETHLGDPAAALSRLMRAFELEPSRRERWGELERLAAATREWQALADLLQGELRDGSRLTDDQLAPLALMLGRLLDDSLNDAEGARTAFETALDVDPENETALDALERLYSQLQQWQELVALFRRRAELVDDPSHRIPYLVKVGRLLEDVRDTRAAIQAYRDVLDLDDSNEEAQQELERIFEYEGHYDDLAELLERRAGQATSDEERAEVLYRLARTLETDLGDAERAVQVYRRILELEAGHGSTVRALEAILDGLRDESGNELLRLEVIRLLEGVYQPDADWQKLVELCEARLELSDDPAQRLSALQRAAELVEGFGGERRLAFDYYARAFREDPRDEYAGQNLERLVPQIRAWGALAETYIDSLTRLQEPSRAIQLMLRTSEILQSHLGQPEGAVRVLEELLELDPRQVEALSRLEALYRELRQFEKLVRVLARRVETTADVLDQKEFLYQMAEIQENRLDDLEGAADTFRRILEIDPEDVVALESLERLLRKAGDFDGLVHILTTKADVVEDDVERRRISLELAAVYERDLHDPVSAIQVYRNLLASDHQDALAIDALDQLYAQTGSWADLLDILEMRRSQARDEAAVEAIDLRSARLLAEELDSVPRAIEVYRGMLARNPEHTEALAALEGLLEGEYRSQALDVLEPLFREWNDWERVVGLLERRLADEPAASKRYVILQEMAEIQEQQLEQPAAAFRELTRALTEQPEASETLESLARLASVHEMWDALAASLDRVAEVVDRPEIQRVFTMRAAGIYEQRLGANNLAVARYRTVLETHPHDRQALAALDRLYFKEQDWEALADILVREIDMGTEDEEELFDLKFRLGYIREMVFADVPAAIARYREILEHRPDHPKAIESLVRLARTDETNEAVTPILAEAYRAQGNWQAIVELYQLALEFARDSARRAELLRAVGEIYETRLDRSDLAFGLYVQSVGEVPDLDVLQKVEALGRSLGAWDDLTRALDEARGRVDSEVQRRELTRKVAGWYDQHLARPDLAEARYHELVFENPADLDALDALDALYQRQQNWDALLDVLDRRAEQTPDPEERREVLARLADLAEGSGDNKALAARAYERMLELTPDDLDRVLQLIRLYLDLGEFEPLIAAMARRAELAEDDGEKAAIHREIGRIARGELADPRRAAEALAASIELDASQTDLLDELESLYRELEEWESLRQLLEGRLPDLSGEERLAVTSRLALLLEDQFDDIDAAIALYQQALAALPGHRRALRELARLQAKVERWKDLRSTYESLERALLEEPDENRLELIQLYLSLSSLQRNQLDDGAGAVETLGRLLDLEPHHLQALDTLARLLEQRGAWADTLGVLDRQITLTTEPDALADLYYRRGCTQAELGSDDDTVLESWERAFENDRARLDVARALKQRYEAATRWEAAWSTSVFLAGAETDPQRRLALAREAARVAREELGDKAKLVESLEMAHQFQPDDLSVADELATAYIGAGAYDRAAPIVDRLVSAQVEHANKRDQAKLYHLKGQVAQGLGSSDSAVAAFQAAYDADAGYLPNLLSLGKIHFAAGNLDDALKMFQTMLLHQMSLKSPGERVDIFYHIARIMALRGDRRRARDMYMRALSINRDHELSKQGLAEVEG